MSPLSSSTPTPQEKCGICEKDGGDWPWPNHQSQIAHRACIHQIHDAQVEARKKILEVLKSSPFEVKFYAHERSIRAVRKTCNMSILEFVRTKGLVALKKIFDREGIAAALNNRSSL